MNKVAMASINNLRIPEATFASPSEQLIILTIGQLRDLIKEAVRETIQPLQAEVAEVKDELADLRGQLKAMEDRADRLEAENTALHTKIASLEATQDQDLNHVFKHIAQDRQRIYALEHPEKEPGKTELSRAEKIAKYLQARPDHKATFETLKGHLGIGNDLLNKAVRALPPERFRVIGDPRDKRKRILVLLPK